VSNRALTWAFEQDLKSGPKFVLVALSDWADDEGSCFPGVATIARRVGSVESAVRENLSRLKQAGLIVEERRNRANGARTSNRYWLQMSGKVDLTPESSGGNLEPESDEPTAGIRGGQEPESGGESEPLELTHQRTTRDVGKPTPTMGSEHAERLCILLADLYEANGSKRPTITKQWLDAARLLIDRDERTPDQVERAIRWSQQDEFWRGNIESMPTLRRQYDRLRLAAERERSEHRGRNPATAVAAGQSLIARLQDQEQAMIGA